MQSTQPEHTHKPPVRLTCLAKVPVFNQLTSEEMDEVIEIIRPARYEKGETIQFAGESKSRLLVLNRGKAKISRTSPDGREQIIRVLEPGDFTGELSVFTDSSPNNDITALEPSSFCTIDGSSLKCLLAQRPHLALKFVSELSEKLNSAEQQLESVSLQTIDQRLAKTILGFAADRPSFDLPISKKDLAAQIGTSPETISRKLRQWQEDLIIELEGQRGVHVLNLDKLKTLAQLT